MACFGPSRLMWAMVVTSPSTQKFVMGRIAEVAVGIARVSEYVVTGCYRTVGIFPTHSEKLSCE